MLRSSSATPEREKQHEAMAHLCFISFVFECAYYFGYGTRSVPTTLKPTLLTISRTITRAWSCEWTSEFDASEEAYDTYSDSTVSLTRERSGNQSITRPVLSFGMTVGMEN